VSASDLVVPVVRRLGALRERVVFVGGAVRGLLITDPGAAPERATDDVDVIVELTSRAEFHRLGADLRAIGFREDTSEGAPLCRWIVDGIKVDVMPTSGAVLGFRNQWYAAAIANAIEVDVLGERFRIVDAPHFCATKLDAYADRGGGDLYHHDLEDVIAIVDGRVELQSELARAAHGVRSYVERALRDLLKNPAFLEALPGHLPGDTASQARLPLVLERLRALAGSR
jgi:predicted nucleotidyltransferase